MKLIIIGSLLFILTGTINAQDSWIRMADFPEKRGNAVSFSFDGYGYIGTGMTSSGPSTNIMRYDPLLDQWDRISVMPGQGRRDAFCFVISGKVYIGGGISNTSSYNNEFWEYSPKENIWDQKRDLPFRQYDPENYVDFTINNRGYLKREEDNMGNFLEYNPETDVWKKLSSFPIENLMFPVGFSLKGKGYIGLGFDGKNAKEILEFWEFDPIINRWSKKADFPGNARTNGISFTVGDYGYIGSGWNASHGGIQPDFWIYTPETNTWLQTSDCPYSTLYGCTFSIGNKAYYGIGAWLFSDGIQIWEFTPSALGIDIVNGESDFSIYPNPATDYLHIETDNRDVERIVIYSISGKSVLEKEYKISTKISLRGISPGVYCIVRYGRNGLGSKNFIVM